MFKNALVYRITQWEQPTLAHLEERLAAARFAECGATQMEAMGAVEPRGEKHGALLEAVAGQWILRLCSERKVVPGSAVKARLEELIHHIAGFTVLKGGGEHPVPDMVQFNIACILGTEERITPSVSELVYEKHKGVHILVSGPFDPSAE